MIGQILFLCYINDIVNIAANNNAHISLYADNAVIFASSDTADNLTAVMQRSHNEVLSWYDLNQINLNVNKTKLCCYGRSHTLS